MQTAIFTADQFQLKGKNCLQKTVQKFIFFIQNVSPADFNCRLLFVTFLLSAANLLAQPVIQWDKTIGGNGNDELTSIQQTPDGGYILGGSSGSGVSGDKTEETPMSDPYWVVKLAADGTKEWDKSFGPEGINYLHTILLSNDGGYLLGGMSNSAVWIVKIDKDGTKLWDKLIRVAEGDEGFGEMQNTSDGGYILGLTSDAPIGYDKSDNSKGYFDYWVVKLASDGTVQWDKTIGGADYDALRSLKQTPDGGYILGGSSYSGIGGDKTEANRGVNDYWVVKLDRNGEKQWDKTIGGESDENLNSIIQVTDGGYVIGGSSNSDASGDKTENSSFIDYWIVKLSADGKIEWDQTLTGGDFNSASGDFNRILIQTKDGGYLTGGSSESPAGVDKSEENRGIQDIWIVKLTADGTKVWDKTIGGALVDFLRDAKQTTDGGFVLAGSSYSNASFEKTENSKGNEDYWVIKLGPEDPMPVTLTQFTAKKENTTALLTWTTTSETRSDRFEIQHSNNGKSWNMLGTVNAKGESTDLANYQYVDTNPVMGSENLYRLKMIDTDGTFAYSKINSLTFDSDLLVNMFPNPVSEILTIKMSDWKNVENVQLINSQSAIVYKAAKSPKNELNVSRFPPGVYLLKVTRSDGSHLSHKVVVAK